MLKEKILNVGDKVLLKCRNKDFLGTILESHDPEVILIKLESGYNIGIREKDILDVEIISKLKIEEKQEKIKEIKPSLPNIALIITGGTISSRLDPKTGGVIPTDEESILNMCPEINEICNISKIERPFMKFSENMFFNDWKIIAKKCESLLNEENIDGVVVTHGTDFLHYSSAALSFMLGKLNKPVAITYSQRSIDRASSDASLNLFCAAKYAISDLAEVAIIGHKDLNDETCLAMPGTKVRKLHTSRRDAFKVVNSTPLAEISKNDFKILRGFNSRDNKRKIKANTQYSDKVALVKIHPGQDPSIFDFYLSKGYKGIILELAGLGQVPSEEAKYNLLPSIKKMIENGMIVCGCAQTIFGSLNLNVYSSGRKLLKTGIIPLKDMLAETAFIKLSWLLGQKSLAKNIDKIKEKMLENIAGEFNECLGIEFI